MAKGYLYDNGDELITREDVNEVPDSSTAHAGDVLELDSNKKPKWTAPESELPSTGSASVGDVLTLDSDKEPVWSTPSGGGGCLLVTASIPTETEGIPEGARLLDKTCNEILAAMTSGVYVNIVSGISGYYEFYTPVYFNSEGISEEGYPYEFGTNNSHFYVVSANGTSQAYLIRIVY